MFEKNLESRIELVRAVSIELSIRGFDAPKLEEFQVDEFRSKLREVRKKRKTALEELQVGISPTPPSSANGSNSCREKVVLSRTSSMTSTESWKPSEVLPQIGGIALEKI